MILPELRAGARANDWLFDDTFATQAKDIVKQISGGKISPPEQRP